jgi:transposase
MIGHPASDQLIASPDRDESTGQERRIPIMETIFPPIAYTDPQFNELQRCACGMPIADVGNTECTGCFVERMQRWSDESNGLPRETTITSYNTDGTQRTNTYTSGTWRAVWQHMNTLSRQYTIEGTRDNFTATNERETVLVTTV